MAQARLIAHDEAQGALAGALSAVLRLPTAARDYLADRLPQLHLVLSGLTKDEARQLRTLREGCEAPGTELFPHLLQGDASRAPGTLLLSGRREQFERLIRALPGTELAGEIARALAPAAVDSRVFWTVGEKRLPARTAVMGVLNVTPDSFSDGGRFLDPERAIARGLELVAEGAELLDVGGESTRPGGGTYGAGMHEVPVEEELRRVLPVIRGLVRQCGVPISVDTRKLEVARAALDEGARIVNDVSGLTHSPELARACAQVGASLCVMHLKGEFQSMQVAPRYDDLVSEVSQFLADAVRRGAEAGISRERIAIDPGLGFGKNGAHNLALLNALPALASLGQPVLVGASRKSFIGALTGVAEPAERVGGSVAAAAAAAMRGASVVRAHDVRATVEALRVVDAVLAATARPDAG